MMTQIDVDIGRYGLVFARQVTVNCYSTGSANKMLRMDTVGIELFQERERERE